MESVYSKRLRAGKRRTYFFDIRETKGSDYFLTITESRKRFDGEGYDRHKVFLYKEDFNKFIKALGEAVDHVKTVLMPDFDFGAFNHDDYDEEGIARQPATDVAAANAPIALASAAAAEVPAPLENPINDEQVLDNTQPQADFIDTGNAASAAHEEVEKW